MASLPSDTAALVIRVWREPGASGFRGRVMSGADPAGPGTAVRDPAQLHAAVQEWLDRFLADRPEHSSG